MEKWSFASHQTPFALIDIASRIVRTSFESSTLGDSLALQPFVHFAGRYAGGHRNQIPWSSSPLLGCGWSDSGSGSDDFKSLFIKVDDHGKPFGARHLRLRRRDDHAVGIAD